MGHLLRFRQSLQERGGGNQEPNEMVEKFEHAERAMAEEDNNIVKDERNAR